MPLIPIRLKTAADVRKLLEDLNQLKLIKLKTSSSKLVEVNPAELTQHLLIGNNGNTYLFEDIQKLSDEEANSIKSVRFFRDADGIRESFSVKKVKRFSQAERKQLLGNKSLAESLSTISYGSDNILNITFPTCPLNGKYFPIIEPVITPSGKTYDRGAIEGWLKHLDGKDERKVEPNSNNPLERAQLISNIALEQLIWTSFWQRQAQRKHFYALAEGKEISKKYLENKINMLNKENEGYKDSLLCKKRDIKEEKVNLEETKLSLEEAKKDLQKEKTKCETQYNHYSVVFK